MAVLDFGRHQQRNGGAVNGGAWSGYGRSVQRTWASQKGCDCAEAFAGTVWESEIVKNCDTASLPSPFSDSAKDRVLKREWHDRCSDDQAAECNGGFVGFLHTIRLAPPVQPKTPRLTYQRTSSQPSPPDYRTLVPGGRLSLADFLPPAAVRWVSFHFLDHHGPRYRQRPRETDDEKF